MKMKLEVNFTPSENKVLLRELAAKKSKGGIILDKQSENAATTFGTVWRSSVEGINPGDKIVYNKFAALDLKLDEGNFLLIDNKAILGTIAAK